MIEETDEIATPEGVMQTFVCHPERDGPHPAVIMYMDAFGIREELRDMARRYATVGYYVALPNLYYRAGIFEPGPLPFWHGEGEPPFHPVNAANAALTIAKVMDDTTALFAFLDDQPAVRPGHAGVVGYCMSGRFAVNAAARFPTRVAAAASLFGTRLITEAEDSPHRMAAKAPGELYFGCAERDHWAPLSMVAELEASLRAGGVTAEVEVYPGVDHAFAFPERQTYDKAAAERHWERMFALFSRRLG